MPWVRLDDRFPEHPKVLAAGDNAAWLFVCILAYCRRHLTGGLVPKEVVGRLTSLKAPGRLAARLEHVGLIEDAGIDYKIHDYHEWNGSDTAARDRARKAARARWDKDAPSNASGNASSNAPSNASGNAERMPTAMHQASNEQCKNDASHAPDHAATRAEPIPSRPVPKAVASRSPTTSSNAPGRDGSVTPSQNRENPQPPVDPLIARCLQVFAGRNRQRVLADAVTTIAQLKTRYDDTFIDECIGIAETVQPPPSMPTYLLKVARTHAATYGLDTPDPGDAR